MRWMKRMSKKKGRGRMKNEVKKGGEDDIREE